MLDIIIFLFPGILLIFSFLIRNSRFEKNFEKLISIIQILISTLISSITTEYLNPGDYNVYTTIFNQCDSINSCLVVSPWEVNFTVLVALIRQLPFQNGHSTWVILNFLLTVIITIAIYYLSKTINSKNFVFLQSFALAFTFPSFLTISIRSGIAFGIILLNLSYVFYKNIIKKIIFKKTNLIIPNIVLIFSSFIHYQSVPLSLFTFNLINNYNLFLIDTTKLNKNIRKGVISKKLLLLILIIISLIIFGYNNFYQLMNIFGKPYYVLIAFKGTQSLGIRTILDQLLIQLIILPKIYNLQLFKDNLKFKNFINSFYIFNIITVFGYYLCLIFLGFDGFARQCQINFLVYLIIYFGTLNTNNKSSAVLFLYSFFSIYYTILVDVSFSTLFK